MKPDILNPAWKYVPAARTSVAATFKRIRREQAEADRKSAESITRIGKMPAQWRR